MSLRRAVAACLVLACPSAAFADQYKVGNVTLEVSDPPSMETHLSQAAPRLMQLMEGYLGGNRLLEAYTTPTELQRLATGLQSYCQLQVTKQLEDKPLISEREFTRHQGEFEEGMAKLFAGTEIDSRAKEQMDSGNKQLQQSTGTNAAVSVQHPTYYGLYDKQPWGIFFSMAIPVKVQSGTTSQSSTQVAAGGIVDAGGKLVNLYCYRLSRGPDDIEQVRRQAREWADAVNRANPAPRGDSHVLGGFDFSRIILFAVIGGLAGLLYKIFGGKKT